MEITEYKFCKCCNKQVKSTHQHHTECYGDGGEDLQMVCNECGKIITE